MRVNDGAGGRDVRRKEGNGEKEWRVSYRKIIFIY